MDEPRVFRLIRSPRRVEKRSAWLPKPIFIGNLMRSWLFLFSCNLMWALQFTCIKLVQDQVGSLFTVWGPMTLATLLLYPFVRSERKASAPVQSRNWKDVVLFMILALIGVFPGQVLVTWGTRISLASNAALLMLALPVCTAVLAVLLLKKRMTRIR